MTNRIHRQLVLTGAHFKHGNQGEIEQDFCRTTDVTLEDGYLDDMKWQDAVLAHCHIVHQMRTMQWVKPLRYEMSVYDPASGDEKRYITFGAGQWGKAPSITALCAATFIELLRAADKAKLKAVP